MDGKKISFGIMKKKITLIQPANKVIQLEKPEKSDVQFIDCLEGSSIKVIGGEEKVKEPLVIPMKPNKKLLNLEELIKNDFVVNEDDVKPNNLEQGKEESDKPVEQMTLDELAARELLKDVKKAKTKKESNRVIDVVHPDKLTLQGEKEPTIDDYEDVPIDEFGLAMLRGMGWKEGTGIGKNRIVVTTPQPIMRPKGMGLGADKVTKQNKDVKPAVDKDGKPLTCCKGAFIKVIAGYHNGSYGQILGFDEESGRLIIKTAINNLNVSLNEFLVAPVTKEEYTKNSKVINNAKYEEYLTKIEVTNENNEKTKDASSGEEKIKIKEKIKKEKINSEDEREEKINKTDIKIKKEKNSDDEAENYSSKKTIKKYEESNSSKRKNKARDKKKHKRYSTSESSSDSESSDEQKHVKRSKKHKEKKRSNSSSSEENCKKTRKEKSKHSDSDENTRKNEERRKDKYGRSRNVERQPKKEKKPESDSEEEYKTKKEQRKEDKYGRSRNEERRRKERKSESEEEHRKVKEEKNRYGKNKNEERQRKEKKHKYDSEEEYKRKKEDKYKKPIKKEKNYDSDSEEYKKRKKDKYKKNKDEDKHKKKEKKYESDSDEDYKRKEDKYKKNKEARYKKKYETDSEEERRRKKSYKTDRGNERYKSHRDKEKERSRYDKCRR